MNLLKCTTCNKILTSEEVKNHNFCNVEINDWKTIYASNITTLKNDEGENCALVEGLNGTSYRIIEKLPNFVNFDPIDFTQQPRGNMTKTTEDETEPNLVNHI